MNLAATGWPGSPLPSETVTSGGASSTGAWQRPTGSNGGMLSRSWPAGSMRESTLGAEILATADCWWDAAYYENNSGYWRNRGTAGPTADLIRSSILPMPWRKPAGEDYLALFGRATQPITCTAPASAVSYAAYRLTDEASSPTTGAVTGGAVFSFGPTFAGNWTQIDLLDASSAVVGSWKASETSNSGYTDAYGVTWSITYNDSANGALTYPILMRTTANGGRPCFGFGATATGAFPRWLNNSAGGLFNVSSGDDITALVVVRQSYSNSVYGDYMSWAFRQASGSEATQRWYIGVGYDVTTGYSRIVPFINGISVTGINFATLGLYGKRVCVAATTTRQGRASNTFLNGVLSSSTAAAGSMQGIQSGALFTLGGNASNSGWFNPTCDFYAAAFFRRSLTSEELLAISTHYGVEG